MYFLQNCHVAAAVAAVDSDAGGDDDGRKLDDLECRPSNSTI